MEDPLPPGKRIQQQAAALLADLKFICKSSQTTIDKFIKGVNSLTDLYLELLIDSVSSKLKQRNGHLFVKDFTTILKSFKNQSLFEGLQSQNKMENFLKGFGVSDPVELKQVVLSWKIKTDSNGLPRKVPHEFGYVVPFLPQLQQHLNCKDVLHCVDNPRPYEPGVFKTVQDGLFYRSHQVVQTHGNKVLAIEMNTDDVEVTDACKSKTKKHRLRVYLWTLLNIHPELRSSLNAIHLIDIVKTNVAKKYGNGPFLKFFVQDMIKMGTSGAMFNISNASRLFHAILVAACCDMPAANNLGGFKETHFANRPCRHCLVGNLDLCTCWEESFDLLRKANDHKIHLELIELYFSENPRIEGYVEDVILDSEQEDVEMAEDTIISEHLSVKLDKHKDPSVKYGINGESILSELPGFDVTKCFPGDIMHLLFEGVVELVCRRILKKLCCPPQPPKVPGQKRTLVKPKVTLDSVNDYIGNIIDFSHYNVSRPSPIEAGHLNKKLRQSASQMIVLIHVLPFIVKSHVSEDEHNLLLLTLDICKICMSFQLTMSDVNNLKSLISQFGETFVKLFPTVKTIKLHSLIHLPTQIMLFGVLRQIWCFRFENMNQEITAPFSAIRNTINIAYSLGKWHVNRRNALVMRHSEGTYLYSGDETTGIVSHTVSELPDKDLLMQFSPSLTDNTEIASCKKLSKNGCIYKNGVVILVDKNDMKFGLLKTIYILAGKYVFLYKPLEVFYQEDLRAYEIIRCSKIMLCTEFSELAHSMPVPKFTFSFPSSTVKSFLLLISPEHL